MVANRCPCGSSDGHYSPSMVHRLSKIKVSGATLINTHWGPGVEKPEIRMNIVLNKKLGPGLQKFMDSEQGKNKLWAGL